MFTKKSLRKELKKLQPRTQWGRVATASELGAVDSLKRLYFKKPEVKNAW